MSIFDFLSRPKKSDAVFGDLVYRRHAWTGAVSIPELHNQSIPLDIQTAKNSDLSAFHPILNCLRENIHRIKDQIAEEAFKTYEIYVQEDRMAGNFSDADYARHPSVSSAADVWRVLKPVGLTLTHSAKEYNSIIWLDVDWPNPHCFVAHLKNADLDLLDVQG